MKIAAAKALADLAKQPVPDHLKSLFPDKNFVFGPNYLIPTPLDPRLITTLPSAIATAAIQSGVAR